MDQKVALAKIASEIAPCRICQKDSMGKPVPGDGNAKARIVFIGEAPGKTEAATGHAFVGRSGKFLRDQIREILKLDDMRDVYITSPVKYLPKRGTPAPAQITHGRTHLLRQLEIIKPKILVLMGRVAALGTLDRPISTTKLHGTSFTENGKTYFISYHPAAAIRFFRHEFIDDFKKLRKLLK